MEESIVIEEKYKSATKLLLEIRDELESLETSFDTSVFMEGRLSINLNNLSRLSEQLEGAIGQLPASKRDLWKIRIKHIHDECKSLRESMGAFLNERYKKNKQEEERAKLLERRTKVAPGSTNSEQLQNMAVLAKQSESIDRSLAVAQDIEDAGYGILGGLGQQNEQIKTIQKKVYDIGITLGLSRSVMKLIERKQFVDKLLVYTGMIVTLLLLFAFWYYIR